MMLIYPIRHEMKLRAKRMSDETLENLEKINGHHDQNYTGITREGRYYFGYLGELVFETLLRERNKVFKYSPKTDGKSDKADFICLFKSGKWRKVEIKSTPSSEHRFIMIPEMQGGRYTGSQPIVGIKFYRATNPLSEYAAEVQGWALFQDFKRVEQPNRDGTKKPTYRFPESECRSIEELFGILEDRDASRGSRKMFT